MINVNDFVYALKRRLPYFNESAISNIKQIENVVVSGQDVFLTITAHGILGNENYASIYGIKYKYNINRILKLPSKYNKNRFAIEVDKLNPVVSTDTAITIKGVTADINYNGVFDIEVKQGDNSSSNGLFSSFILETNANITENEILNQGYILYEIIESPFIKNALNGYKNISVVDLNTIKFTLNSAENLYEWEINQLDFSSAKIGRVDAYLISNEDIIDTRLISAKTDKFLIFINETRDSDSNQGITNSSASITNNSLNNLQFINDIFFNVHIVSRKAVSVTDNIPSLKDEQQLITEYNDIRNAIRQIICTTTIKIQKPFNTEDNSFSRPIRVGGNFEAYYGNGTRLRWINEFKCSVLISPGTLPDENVSSPLNIINLDGERVDGEINYFDLD